MTTGGAWPPDPLGSWVIDLDGVVWLTGEPLPGAPEAIGALRSAGARVLFATNNSSPTVVELLGRLDRAGIVAGEQDVVSSGHAAGRLVAPGERVAVLGEAGLEEALRAAGAELVEGPPVATVIVARTPSFDYESLDRASAWVRDGARLLGTSEDPTHPTPHGLVPGSGSVLAAVSVASGVRAVVAGKPHGPMCDLIGERLGPVSVVVGDRPSTDGLLAARLGARFALIRSEATAAEGEGRPDDHPVAAVAPSLGELVRGVLGVAD